MALTKVSGPLLHGSNDNLGNYVINNITGAAATFSSVSVGGTLTYDDVTNVDSIGIVTARGGLHVGAGGTIIYALSEDNGNIGIGTTDASHQITVYAKSANSTIARFKAINRNANFDIVTDSSSHGQARVRNNIGATKVLLNSNGDSYFTGGSVGIGTISPAGNLEIDVDSSTTDMIMLDVDSTNFAKIGHNSSSGTAVLDIRSEGHTRFLTGGNNERLRITSGGNIEVSTTTDTNPRYLRFNSDRSNADDALGGIHGIWNGNSVAGITFKTGADTSNKDDGRIQFLTYEGGSSSTRMMILENGRVGIGSEDPQAKLVVAAASGDTIFELQRSNTNTTGAVGVINFTALDGHSVANIQVRGDGNDEGGAIQFRTTSAAASRDPFASPHNGLIAMQIKSDGQTVLDGSNSQNVNYPLQINNSAAAGNGTDPDVTAIAFASGASTKASIRAAVYGEGWMSFHNNDNSEKMRLLASGNLGIGSQAPEQRLDVAGAVDITHYANTTINNERLQLGFNAPEGYIKAKNTTGSPAANIALYNTDTSGNTNRTMHLRYDGNVGINTNFVGSQSWRSGKTLEIFGGSGNVTGELHLGANRGDGQQSVGSINFFDNTQDTDHKHIAIIEADKVGNTSNKRGGDILFYTKNNNVAAPTEKMRIHNDGSVSIGNNPDVHDDTIFHVQKPSGETNVKFEGDDTMGARLSLHNNDTSTSAKNQIDFCDAGGQSTSSIQGFNTDQTNNLGELVFATRNAQGTPPEERIRIESDGQVTITGPGTKYTAWAGTTPLNVNTIAMVNAGSADTNNWGWGLRGNSGDTQWCVERIKDQTSFADVNIKFRVYSNGNYLFAGTDQSDRDIKENILDISGTSLDKIKQLRPRTFNFMESEGYSTETKTGFIAQEVASVIPSITNGTDGQKDMGVDYNGLVAHLVKALQEEIVKREALEARISALEGS